MGDIIFIGLANIWSKLTDRMREFYVGTLVSKLTLQSVVTAMAAIVFWPITKLAEWWQIMCVEREAKYRAAYYHWKMKNPLNPLSFDQWVEEVESRAHHRSGGIRLFNEDGLFDD